MASKNISFDNIPSSIRKPGKYFEFNTKLAVRTLPQNRQEVLIVAQKLAAGSVAAETPVMVFSDIEAAEYCGYGSQVHLMARAMIKANPYVALTLVGVDDNVAGVAATGTSQIDIDAVAAGTVRQYIGNEFAEIAVAKGDVKADIAAALKAAIDAKPDLPVTAAVVTDTITLTAKNKGVVGDDIHLSLIAANNCVTATITAMTGGSGDPDIATALAAVFGKQYHKIVVPYGDSTTLTALRDHIDAISGPMEQRPSVGVYALTGALAAATTLAGTLNSGRLLGAYLRNTRSLPMELAAAMAGIMAWEEDPARPLNTLAIKGIHAPDIEDRLSRTEQETCLNNGVTPFEVGPGEKVQVVRAISTYTKDGQGIDDVSLLDITTITTLDYVRKACRERISLRFPREKLSSKTPKKVRSELLDVLLKLEDLEIVEEVMANKDGLVVERDLQEANRLDAKIPADVVNGLHVFAGRIDLLL
ncbi:MAG: phage tail sheath subtilisin-like domain-containing protein [Desulfobacula sp.]|nr:phage tail sheath subtilisin-like domain-containing protein [Desulfobacula sp.]